MGFDVSEVNTPLGISFKRLSTVNAFKVWLASSNHVYEGFKLIPVETLEEALSWANCASSESWNDEQREEIDKHYRVIEKSMTGAGL